MQGLQLDKGKITALTIVLLGLGFIALPYIIELAGIGSPGFGPKQVLIFWFGMALELFGIGLATPSFFPQLAQRKFLRNLLYTSWAMLWVVWILSGAEVYSRQANPIWHSELGNLHMQPYFMTGGFFQTSVQGIDAEEVLVQPVGPEAYGYTKHGNTYIYKFDEEVSSISERGNFLFQDRVDIANDVDNRDVLRVFVIGASAAYGTGASSEEHRWYAVLERRLSESTGKQVVLIPAAIPGYTSTQERLILDLMVLPRNPDAIVFLDGFNDASLPALFGFRPGDPFNQGILYGNYYSPLFGVKKWLAQYSHFYRFMFNSALARDLDENALSIAEDPQKLDNYVTSVSSVYLDNIRNIQEHCQGRDIPCLVFLQPSQATTYRNQGSTRRIDPVALAAYNRIQEMADWNESGARLYDLTTVFDDPGKEKWYIDTVHFRDEGHEDVAQEMLPAVLEAIGGP